MCTQSQHIANLSFMAHPCSKREKVMAVIYGFFDGSYEGREQPSVIAVAGFVAPEQLWLRFADRWDQVLSDPRLPCKPKRFHAYDCVHGFGEFEGWGFAHRLGLWGDLVGVLISSDLLGVGSALICEHFYALDEATKARLRNPYHLPVECCIQHVLVKMEEEMPEEKVTLVFDVENKPIADESYIRYRLYKQSGLWKNLAGFTQISSFDALPLQAADLLAYGSFIWHRKAYYPETRDLDFPIVPAFARLLSKVENIGSTYDEGPLSRLIAQIREREGIAWNVCFLGSGLRLNLFSV
jgi:hypothetical protein